MFRIIFFGTPDFAVGSLKALIEAGKNVVAVVTAPDKPAGRGKQLQSSAVKQYALEQNLPVLQPEKLKAPDFIAELTTYKADLQVVVAFRMLPEIIWNMPPHGTINVHGSLLPQYRGAAPINWAIINGETETGVTTFKLKHEIDTGNILLQHKMDILPEDDFGTVYEKLMMEGGKLLVETVTGLENNTLIDQEQTEAATAQLQHAPKLFKEMMQIDWTKSALQVHNHIRGLSPYPAAWTLLQGKIMKVFVTHIDAGPGTTAEPGTMDTDSKTYLRYAAADGLVYIDELQLEGKKRMKTEEFLRGFRIS